MSTTQNSVDNASLEDRLYTVKYEDPGESHLDVKVTGICEERCRTDDCVDVCPADVWREGEDGVPHIAYENCLECSSCRFACPHNNVVWTYPENGSGVTYSFG
ncbi:ferredoxin family protein [Natranaeroarchaeum aerophilus]|uniref:Ferredoxin-like protein n=1 Tax=Natranaeroarchaeum aerophilus TaxID=2917711 RepID=A0AAE3FPD4_9EURY|nr:4Fe-4S dicluster domain-containing protein [Natranaeroarchaeum aerophilus]MCL9812716.1 4Fe-4S dicluster domain-containing protein [Natranaeroarchaeum aerophilus]